MNDGPPPPRETRHSWPAEGLKRVPDWVYTDAAVYQREKPEQITDASAIEAMIDQVIAANPKQVEQYRAGKKTVSGFFVGQVMKASMGQANPALLNELVTKKLEG